MKDLDVPDSVADEPDDEDSLPVHLRGKSRLVWTARDHAAAGSTPSAIYQRGPTGKRQIDLMSDKEIERYVHDELESLGEFKRLSGDIPGLYERMLRAFRRDVSFLREIGRLPPDFKEIPADD